MLENQFFSYEKNLSSNISKVNLEQDANANLSLSDKYLKTVQAIKYGVAIIPLKRGDILGCEEVRETDVSEEIDMFTTIMQQ